MKMLQIEFSDGFTIKLFDSYTSQFITDLDSVHSSGSFCIASLKSLKLPGLHSPMDSPGEFWQLNVSSFGFLQFMHSFEESSITLFNMESLDLYEGVKQRGILTNSHLFYFTIKRCIFAIFCAALQTTNHWG